MKPPRPCDDHPGPWKVLIRRPGERTWRRAEGSPYGTRGEAMEVERSALAMCYEARREPL